MVCGDLPDGPVPTTRSFNMHSTALSNWDATSMTQPGATPKGEVSKSSEISSAGIPENDCSMRQKFRPGISPGRVSHTSVLKIASLTTTLSSTPKKVFGTSG